jgi:serine/threonine protein kinase
LSCDLQHDIDLIIYICAYLFNQTQFRNHAICSLDDEFLRIHGVTQDPITEAYIIVMQYANDGDLLSYLNRNINKLTWTMKLWLLNDIADSLSSIHTENLVHCDLHGGNIILHKYAPAEVLSRAFICDFGSSRSTVSESTSDIQGVLPFVAPEVFTTRKFTQKSDIYAFGIIMHLIATGEPPLRDKLFDKDLACKIVDGLRPTMPDTAPDKYRKLAEKCCDADPDKRPDIWKIQNKVKYLLDKVLVEEVFVSVLTEEDTSGYGIWNTIYHNDRKLYHA